MLYTLETNPSYRCVKISILVMPFGSPCVQWPENTFDQTVDVLKRLCRLVVKRLVKRLSKRLVSPGALKDGGGGRHHPLALFQIYG